MKTCKHCRKDVQGSHYCTVANRTIESDSDGDFLLSMAVGMATDSALLGFAVGGSLTGALLGDFLGGDD